jgi:hypothetical protein
MAFTCGIMRDTAASATDLLENVKVWHGRGGDGALSFRVVTMDVGGSLDVRAFEVRRSMKRLPPVAG